MPCLEAKPLDKYVSRPRLGWVVPLTDTTDGLLSSQYTSAESLGDCKAYMANNYAELVVHADTPITLRSYAMGLPDKAPQPDATRLAAWFGWWDQAFGIPRTQVEKYDNIKAYRITPANGWLYGPPGVLTHGFLARTGAYWTGDLEPMEFLSTSSAISAGDKACWTCGHGTLRYCMQANHPPYPYATWDRYLVFKPRTPNSYGYYYSYIHDDGFTHAPHVPEFSQGE